MEKIFLLIPALEDVGPVKGAVAIANGLCKYYDVCLVVLKKNHSHNLFIKSEIEIISLNRGHLWFTNYQIYKKTILERCGNKKPVSISMCFSADCINFFVKDIATIISSVRANLPVTYFYTYGWLGNILAKFHIHILKKFQRVISMSETMSTQLSNYGVKNLYLVGNFIEENKIHNEKITKSKIKKNYIRMVALASLTKRKRIDLLIDAVMQLKIDGIQIKLDLLGEGPLEEELKGKMIDLNLSDQISFHGQLNNPFLILQKADYFVLPSEAEGVSRASLEALFFGIPCILRDIDANSELITHGDNGYLFKDDNDFVELLRTISTSDLKYFERKSLIPRKFQQENSIGRLVKLIENYV